MKNPKSNPWSFWQTAGVRMFVKRHMNPLTPQVAGRRKTILATGYFISSVILIHWYLFTNYDIIDRRPDADLRKALKINLDEAKVFRFVDGRLTEVIDYDSDDYQHLVEEKES